MIKLLEPELLIKCRKEDVQMVKEILPECQNEFVEIMKRESSGEQEFNTVLTLLENEFMTLE